MSDALRIIFLFVEVHFREFRLHGHLFFEASLLVCEHVHVAAALTNNLTGALAGLVNFTNSLYNTRIIQIITEPVKIIDLAVKDLDLLCLLLA